MIETALEIAMAFGALAIFAMAFGLALDNHAARLDPSTPYYVAAQLYSEKGGNCRAVPPPLPPHEPVPQWLMIGPMHYDRRCA